MPGIFINLNNIRLIRQISNKHVTPTEKHILEVMGGYAHDDGSSIRPSVATIADDTGLKHWCIVNTIKSLDKIEVVCFTH